MKFRIIAKPADGDMIQFVFDNMTNEVFDSDGNPVDFHKAFVWAAPPMPIDLTPRPIFSPTEPLIGKDQTIRKLKIQLGMACNYRCAYCNQARYRELNEAPAPKEGTVDRFFSMLDSAGVVLDKDGDVELWGGEPLVYWKTIREILPCVRERYGSEITIKVVTNGSLLTEAIVDELVRYRVSVTISHDGPGFVLRDNDDPLDNPSLKAVWLDLFDKTTKVGIPLKITSVITPKNADLYALKSFFAEKFSPDVELNLEGVVTNTGVCGKGCRFDAQSARQLDSSIFRALVTEAGQWPALEGAALDLTSSLVHKIPAETVWSKCDTPDPKVLAVNLEGTVLSCQNYSAPLFGIGSLKQYDQIKNPFFTHWKRRPYCANCPFISSCSGGCPNLTNEELDECCDNEFVFHAAIFSAVWFRLTRTIVHGIEPL